MRRFERRDVFGGRFERKREIRAGVEVFGSAWYVVVFVQGEEGGLIFLKIVLFWVCRCDYGSRVWNTHVDGFNWMIKLFFFKLPFRTSGKTQFDIMSSRIN